jgi:hypothetical protein
MKFLNGDQVSSVSERGNRLRYSGLILRTDSQQIGSRPGLGGYQDAVRYVYKLFNQPVDQNALNAASKPPKTSVILDPCPDTIEEYFAQLWTYCFQNKESTLAALFMFTMIRQSDIGNDVENGGHAYPLRPQDRNGDIVSWHIIWRQAWYGAVIAQLTSMSTHHSECFHRPDFAMNASSIGTISRGSPRDQTFVCQMTF